MGRPEKCGRMWTHQSPLWKTNGQWNRSHTPDHQRPDGLWVGPASAEGAGDTASLRGSRPEHGRQRGRLPMPWVRTHLKPRPPPSPLPWLGPAPIQDRGTQCLRRIFSPGIKKSIMIAKQFQYKSTVQYPELGTDWRFQKIDFFDDALQTSRKYEYVCVWLLTLIQINWLWEIGDNLYFFLQFLPFSIHYRWKIVYFESKINTIPCYITIIAVDMISIEIHSRTPINNE